MRETPYLSIVIPAFNEAHRLPASLREIAASCEKFIFPYEVLVVVEKSGDGTLELAVEAATEQANFLVINNVVHRGKGFAVRTGMLRAQGEVILFMDADLSVPLDEIGTFLRCFERDPSIEVIVGNRQHPESEIIRRQTFLRRTMGQTFNWLLRRIVGARLLDTQCGFKAFRRDAARAIFSRQKLDGFAFDVEVLLLAEQLGLRVVDLPVRWINSPRSTLSLLKDSFKMLRDAAHVRKIVEETLRENPMQIHPRKF